MKKGKLLVITGLSGSGKDSVIEEFLIKETSFKRLITCADRSPREGEINGVHYYFVSEEKMDEMYVSDELVEKPLRYGTSRKATPKKEFKKITQNGENLIWRIESSLAAHVASGKFFEETFPGPEGQVLKESTTIVFITANKNDVDARRKLRDGKKYDPKDYKKRDEQDEEIMKSFGHLFENIIENKNGELGKTVEKIIDLL